MGWLVFFRAGLHAENIRVMSVPKMREEIERKNKLKQFAKVNTQALLYSKYNHKQLWLGQITII